MDQLQRIQILEARSQLLRTTRDFFYEKSFIEVQTPTLSNDTMVDGTIDPVPVTLAGHPKPLFLQTSPEFAMKRLLIEGCRQIFEITPAFRNSESGQLHNPEFTMLEWYRIGDNYAEGMRLLEQFIAAAIPGRSTERVTFRKLFEDAFQIDPHLVDPAKLFQLCRSHQLSVPSGVDDSDSLLQILMTEIIEPNLGHDQCCIVTDWPQNQSALAKTRPTNEGYEVAERFELYANGIEIANGYHELTDPQEQMKRLTKNNVLRSRNDLPLLPLDSRLMEAMSKSGLADCSGVAVGFDRLLMVKLGLSHLSQVLTYEIGLA